MMTEAHEIFTTDEQILACNEKGFTLIELMVVAIILAIIAAIAVPIYNQQKASAYIEEVTNSSGGCGAWAKMALAKLENGKAAPTTDPADSTNFSYAVNGKTCTATYQGADTNLTGDTIVVTVDETATPPTKTWTGTGAWVDSF